MSINNRRRYVVELEPEMAAWVEYQRSQGVPFVEYMRRLIKNHMDQVTNQEATHGG